MKYGYQRVSAHDQSFARQELTADCNRIFKEKVSGKNTDRLQLSILRDIIQPSDEIVVYLLDRLARSLRDLEMIVKEVVNKGAVISFMKEHLTFGPTTNPFAEMMMQVLGAIGQFERALILDRQREGIAKAKEAGKYKGRPSTINRSVAEKMFNSGSTPAEVTDVMKIGTASAYRLRKEI